MRAGQITCRELGALIGGLAAAGVARAVEQPIYLSHIKLRVADFDRSVAFYYGLFGGETMEIKGGSHFAAPDMKALVMKIAPSVDLFDPLGAGRKTPVGLEHRRKPSTSKAHRDRESILFHDSDGNAVKVFSMDVST